MRHLWDNETEFGTDLSSEILTAGQEFFRELVARYPDVPVRELSICVQDGISYQAALEIGKKNRKKNEAPIV